MLGSYGGWEEIVNSTKQPRRQRRLSGVELDRDWSGRAAVWDGRPLIHISDVGIEFFQIYYTVGQRNSGFIDEFGFEIYMISDFISDRNREESSPKNLIQYSLFQLGSGVSNTL